MIWADAAGKDGLVFLVSLVTQRYATDHHGLRVYLRCVTLRRAALVLRKSCAPLALRRFGGTVVSARHKELDGIREFSVGKRTFL